MSKLILTPYNFAGNQLQNAVIQNLASAPTTGLTNGLIYWDTTLQQLLTYNATATAWQNLATNSLLLQGQNGAYYLARANQSGTQLAATISNLSATVLGYTLDTFASPVAPLNMNGQRVSNVGTPTVSTDAATKSYVDSNIIGLSPKPTARAATTAALPANVYANGTAGVGATLTATANGVLVIDTYTPALNDVLLIKNEAAPANNGLYNITTLGSVSVPYVLTRNADMNQSTTFGGALIAVENVGSVNANSLWMCNIPNSITVGTTAVTLTQLNSAVTISGSTSILISGNVASAIVAPSGGVVIGALGLSADRTQVANKYAQTFGDGSTLSYVITHGLGTLGVTNGQDVTVQVYQAASPFNEIECDVGHTTVNTVTLGFAVAPTFNQYRVVVHG